ncbi:DUF5106 domain-containing protein [Marinilongibacter aquaticus]|uniref:TlpA family protein disulfide reductase n=1 Tax=Marinilongibacter aquaticus TaxID=2975157 RepID=UPI0021BDEC56|nr:TlpA family protein disulfide reductase [Marinilongibacter aquaticus]UBM60673.1 DUF5106 domain-containing protein [Marinilongibacter aquaticus]
MQKLFLGIVFVLQTAFCAAQGYDIRLKLNGLEEGSTIQLAHFLGYNQYIKVDSAKMENGLFQFSGAEPLKGGIYLFVISPSKYYDFIVSGDEPSFEIAADTSNFIESVKVSGSKENEILFGYRKFLQQVNQEAMAVNAKYAGNDPATAVQKREELEAVKKRLDTYIDQIEEQNKDTFAAKVIAVNKEIEVPKEIPLNPDGSKDSTFAFRYYKSHFWDGMDFSDPRMIRTPFLQSKLEKYFKELVYQLPDSVNQDADLVIGRAKKDPEMYRYVLWWVTNKYENPDIVGLDAVFVHLAEAYYLKDADWLSEEQIEKFKERVKTLKPLVTGNVFPKMHLYDMQGNLKLSPESKGRYTILYFYSPDCSHCKDAAPDLVKYAAEAKEKGIVIYNISVDHDEKKIAEFIEKYGTGKDMINLWDKGTHYDFRKSYDVYSTPTSYILDENLRIIGKRIKIEEFDKFIQFHENQTSR